jgi:hypothetical protein
MKKHNSEEGMWETASLEWIHRVRSEQQANRKGEKVVLPSHEEAEKLAKQYGLRLVRPTTAAQ